MTLAYRFLAFLAVIGTLALTTLFFFPELDVSATAYFYDAPRAAFMPEYMTALEAVHSSTPIFVGAAALALVSMTAFYATSVYAKGNAHHKIALARCVLALCLWIAGPGIIVNSLFKNEWGRARPHQTWIFGGDKEFTRVFVKTDQCERNCSFSSGDPAAAAAFVAFGLVDRRRRYYWLAGSLILAAGLGAARVMQGKHFLSDVLSSMAVVYGLYALADWLVRTKLSLKKEKQSCALS